MNSRNSILRGQKPNASHFSALQAADNTLRMVCMGCYHSHESNDPSRQDPYLGIASNIGSQELLAISDAHVENTLRSQDVAQGKWLGEDPSLAQIQQCLMSR